ncbi:Uncharacterised protein [Mycobacteroides abscessus subsp. abscessus]|nr:Uncharacterised protein [Mycobacteroides abscessus subsp. abscessus]
MLAKKESATGFFSKVEVFKIINAPLIVRYKSINKGGSFISAINLVY